MRNSILVFFLAGLVLVSCKKNEVTIDPISIPNPARVVEGKWRVIQTKAEGNAKIANATVPVEGSNISPPVGFYNMVVGEEENTYNYDLKTLLQLRFGQNGNTLRDYDYNDKDAGTWILKSDQQLVFYANQGNVQDIFFTKYDSADLEILQLSLPIDTTLEGIGYSGKIVVDLIKDD